MLDVNTMRVQEQKRPDIPDFEREYMAALPRVPFTEAHRRLELLRKELVAARTCKSLKLRFDGSCSDENEDATLREVNKQLP